MTNPCRLLSETKRSRSTNTEKKPESAFYEFTVTVELRNSDEAKRIAGAIISAVDETNITNSFMVRGYSQDFPPELQLVTVKRIEMVTR